MADTRKSPFGRMFMEHFLQMTERISGSFSKASGKSAKEQIAFLDLRSGKAVNIGLRSGVSWEIRVLSHGEDSMLNIGESPRDASVCSLSSILEDNVPLKYYLSERACLGILRRSEERGKPLDDLLKTALLNTVAFMRWITTRKTSGSLSEETVLSKRLLDEWAQGGGTEVLTLQPIGVDLFNAALTGERTKTICAARSDHEHLPCVAVPYTLKIRGGCAGGGKGALSQKYKSATLACGNDQTLFVPTQTESGEVIYLVRKLTPTECASLQGFEKDWCALVPHKDAAEYKMWGNGMAFPCMLYIMEGVQRVLAQRQLENLFGGDGP